MRDKIIAAYQAGESSRVIGRRYGVSYVTVLNVLRRNGVAIRDASAAARRYSVDTSVFDANTPDAAYWLGVLLADGCIRLCPNPSIQYGVAAIDAEHVDAFRTFLKAEHPIKVRAARRTVLDGRLVHSTPLHSITIPNRQLVASLMRHGIQPRKSLTARVPKGLSRSKDFWRGVIDGDGCLGIYRDEARLELVGSLFVVTAFARFVRRLVPRCKAQPRQRGRIFVLSLSCGPAVKVTRVLYQDAATALPRKAALATRIAGMHAA